MNIKLDKELQRGLDIFNNSFNGGLDLTNIIKARKILNDFYKKNKKSNKSKNIEIINRYIPGYKNSSKIKIRIYRSKIQKKKMPALLWIHGGGMVMSSPEYEDDISINFVEKLNCVVVSVDYRLAPEHPYPAAIHDCYGALKWMYSNTDKINIHKSKIAVGGASAGGGLAAGLSLFVRDKKEIEIIYQLLIYPMIDNTNVNFSSKIIKDTLVWDKKSNSICWKYYLKNIKDKKNIPIYAAPSRAKDLSNLPTTFVLVGSLDLFLNENISYAKKLIKCGIQTELHIYNKGYHGFNNFAPDADISIRFNNDIIKALKKAL